MPAGRGPFPAVVILHGCGGLSPQLERWSRWFADRGYVGMVVDSFGPRKVKGDCAPETPEDIPVTARLDDAMRARALEELSRAAQSLTGASETTISSPSV